MIDDNTAALVELHTGLPEAKAVRIGHAADRNEDDVGLDCFRRAAFRRLDGHLQSLAG